MLPDEEAETCITEKTSHTDAQVRFLPPELPHGFQHDGVFTLPSKQTSSAPFVVLLRWFSSPWTAALISPFHFLHRVAEWVNPLDMHIRLLCSVLALGTW